MEKWTLASLGKKFMSTYVLIAIAIFAICFIFVPSITSFAAVILKGSIGILAFYLFDKFMLKEIDTIEELRKGNIAYSIFLACITAIIVAGIISS